MIIRERAGDEPATVAVWHEPATATRQARAGGGGHEPAAAA